MYNIIYSIHPIHTWCVTQLALLVVAYAKCVSHERLHPIVDGVGRQCRPRHVL
eukprot:COSAG01_NODE_70887_length_257_cov_0.981013_1_plen_52_part_01